MIIFVKTPAGHVITFGHLEPDNTVAFVKLLIYDIESTHAADRTTSDAAKLPLLPSDMLLIHRGTLPLQDEQTLRETDIPDRTTLLVLPKKVAAADHAARARPYLRPHPHPQPHPQLRLPEAVEPGRQAPGDSVIASQPATGPARRNATRARAARELAQPPAQESHAAAQKLDALAQKGAGFEVRVRRSKRRAGFEISGASAGAGAGVGAGAGARRRTKGGRISIEQLKRLTQLRVEFERKDEAQVRQSTVAVGEDQPRALEHVPEAVLEQEQEQAMEPEPVPESEPQEREQEHEHRQKVPPEQGGRKGQEGQREERRPKAVRGLRGELPNGLHIEIMLQGLAACRPLLAARRVVKS